MPSFMKAAIPRRIKPLDIDLILFLGRIISGLSVQLTFRPRLGLSAFDRKRPRVGCGAACSSLIAPHWG